MLPEMLRQPASARSYGSDRRLNIFGTRSLVNGSAQIRIVPVARAPRNDFPVFVTKRDQIAIIVEVDKFLSRAVGLLTPQIGQLIVAIEMHLEGLATCVVPFQQFFLDVRLARRVGIQSSPPIISFESRAGCARANG
jgi:hypothetical protein